MAAPKLSLQDKKDLDKFAKYLVYKCIQIIVQSRLGEKVHTHSKAFSSGSDWFNLGVNDIPEVKAETIKVFNGNLNMGQNVCVEVSLKTAEGETMILETWWLTLTEQTDPTARISYTVYNRMGILLKSLFSVSRATPAYRLSRRQGPETFVICYRVYMGEPQCSHLGEGYKKSKIGSVPTPVGTYGCYMAYRTKMLISPHTSAKDLSEDLQENHFNSESSPKKINQPQPCHMAYRERRISCGDDGLLFGEPQDICNTTFTSSPSDHYLYSNGYGTIPPHPMLQRKPSGDSVKGEDNKENVPSKSERLQVYNGPRVCAFAPDLELDGHPQDEEDDIPFGSLLHACPHVDHTAHCRSNSPDGDTSNEDTVDARMSYTNSHSGSSSTCNRSSNSQGSAPEDFVMVELKTPFAGPEGNSDLGRFYQDCQTAPPLTMFHDTVTVQDTLNAITDQLAIFEASATDFDSFVESLQTASEG